MAPLTQSNRCMTKEGLWIWLIVAVISSRAESNPVREVEEERISSDCIISPTVVQISACDMPRMNTTEDQNNCSGLFTLVQEQSHTIHKLVNHLTQDTCPRGQFTQQWFKDCAELRSVGYSESGRYIIKPADNGDPFAVYCDMDTPGEGWTVIQRRQDGSVDFYLKWLDYKYGFGNVKLEHWLGNDKIHRLTSQKVYKLRIDVADFDGNTAYAEYNSFLVAGEELNYQLIIGEYQGTAGDSLTYHHGHEFSTHDADHDPNSNNCAANYHGAWWYNSCHWSNLNGQYIADGAVNDNGLSWYYWQNSHNSMKMSEMKIHPTNH